MAPQQDDVSTNPADEDSKLEDYSESLRSGQNLASPPPGEAVVISGLSGVFPDSRDVYHFRDNLYNKVDMVTDDDRRWSLVHPEIPKRGGKLFDIEKFDAGYFGVHCRQADAMDPVVRIFLEKALEAIMDAGVNPAELEGSNTGVFVGACFSESDKTWFLEKLYPQYFAVTGLSRSMIPNRLSYLLKLSGPSHCVDTACSSSLYALEHAYKAIRNGDCDRAIVGGTNLCLHPFVSLQFARLGVLSKDGACKVFDIDSDGYARSEAIAAIFLEKAKNSKRIYAEIVHAKTNCDGYKQQGITFPSSDAQKRLLQEFYQECNVNPTTLSFLEAHGTGTKVGDPEEVEAIDAVFCHGRETPLMVGSVKSNIGHSEPSSGLCSITKVIIGMENGLIPPNMNFTRAREGLEALEKGRLKVVTEKTPFEDNRGLIGVNSFGFGGGNCHVLLKWNEKTKTDKGLPLDDLPRLLCVSGRLESSITSILDDVSGRVLDAEHVRLYQQLFEKNLAGHFYRGYSILSKRGEIKRSSAQFLGTSQNLCVVFGDFGNSWRTIINHLAILPIFEASIQRTNKILITKGLNFIETIKGSNETTFNQIIGTVVAQIGIVEVLRVLEVNPDYFFGYGVSELVCAYFDGCLELNETVLAAYQIATIFGNLEKNFAKIKPQLLQSLKEIVLKPKPRGTKWLSSNETSSASAEHFVTTLNIPLNSNQLTKKLQRSGVVVEIGTNPLNGLDDSLKRLSFDSVGTSNGFVVLLEILGSLYESGYNPRIDRLYPEIKYPVSRGTPMISPKIKWNHSKNWFVTHYTTDNTIKSGEKNVRFSPKEDVWQFFRGHVIDGRDLFPATGYLYFVWEVLGLVMGMMTSDMQVVFENCKFHRATHLSKDSKTDLTVQIQRGSGNFEVIEGGNAVATGRIYMSKTIDQEQVRLPLPQDKHLDDDAICLSTKDIYKELRLRGYNYKGAFRRMKQCDVTATKGLIHWDANWITFMDGMLQMKILQTDTRFLYVPTEIRKMSINAKKHIALAQSLGENPCLTVYTHKDNDVLKCGGIEIRGLIAASIPRRKPRGDPVLEKYEFVPNFGRLNTNEAVRLQIQLILENLPGMKVKVVELLDEATQENSEPLATIIHEALGDLPLIRPEILVLSKELLEIPNVAVEDQKLVAQTDCHLVVASKVLQRAIVLNQAFGAIKEHAFILTREPLDFEPRKVSGIEILTAFETQNEKLILIKKSVAPKPATIIEIVNSNDDEFQWLPNLQNALKNGDNVIVVAQNEPLSGILGLVNCLRREPKGSSVRCVFLADNAPFFDSSLPFYEEQLKKNFAINVYKNSCWGTYRHFLLEAQSEIESEHCFVNVTQRGDLSSLKWIQGPLSSNCKVEPEEELVHVYYAALNFRDIMTATGRINSDVVTRDRTKQECVQGFEFSGRTTDGKRVFGMIVAGALSTMVKADKYMCWKLPDHFSLEDGATIPVVYGTVIHALYYVVTIKKGNTILIHAGSGGIGLAAITIALHKGLTVYTTVGTKEKRDFLKTQFPQLKDYQIGNSRDTSFETMIFQQTNGRGVDFVLNSLAEEKLEASIRCLARGGHFLEIGKFDLANNRKLQLLMLEKEASFHGIMLDDFFTYNVKKDYLKSGIEKAINDGVIKPLVRTTFKSDEIEKAFRFMASGKHVGKVLVQIRQEENVKVVPPPLKLVKGVPRYTCNSDNVYVIVGGLGGFGLELADWLVMRGARKIVLTSRKGVKTGYQSYRIGIWTSYGAIVHVSTCDVTKIEGCETLLKEANSLGKVEAIFNLAVVLKDALLENQTPENFKLSLEPKAFATKHLDEISRKLCPSLRNFVIFSSVSCGRGNAGQTNYGMANSIMERICEKRKEDGFPALAIQWGAVGDVGLVADMQELDTQIEIGGTLTQSITSCLQNMDHLLNQNNAVVASMVVAEKRRGGGGADNIVDAVANILGLRDIKTVSQHSTLAEVGMDSMSAVEIKQTLEREFEVFLTPQDMRDMTFARLQEIQDEKLAEGSTGTKIERPVTGFEMMLRLIEDEETAKIPLVELKTKIKKKQEATRVFLFPGMEGVSKVFENFAANLNVHAVCVQFPNESQDETIEGMARRLITTIEPKLPKTEPFRIIAYSYGVVLAMEVVSMLEEMGYGGTLVCLDGAPYMLRTLLKATLDVGSEALFQTGFICQLLSLHVPFETVLKNKERLLSCKTFEERLNVSAEIVPNDTIHSTQYWKLFATSTFNRLRALDRYHPSYPKIKSKVKLFKPEKSSLPNLPEDYRLAELCENQVEVKIFKGNHVTMLENLELADVINATFGAVTTYLKESILLEGAGKINTAQAEVKQI